MNIDLLRRFTPNRRLWTLLGLALGLLTFLAVLPWLQLLFRAVPSHRIVLHFLAILEVVYLLVLALGVAGPIYFSWRVLAERRRGRPRGSSLRGLTLAGLLAGGRGGRGATAAWLAWDASVRARTRAATGLARDYPLPTELPDKSDPSELTLVVLGESSAVGFPCQEWMSVGRIVAWQLGMALPARRIVLETIAHEGDTLELQHQRLARLRRRPDLVLIYCGHNEFAARYAAQRDTVYYRDRLASGPGWRLGAQVIRLSAFARFVRQIAEQYRVSIPPGPRDRRSVVDVPAYTAEEYAERVADFRRRLERIVEFSLSVGALPILLVPPGNDAGFEPNRSFLTADTVQAKREEFARLFQSVRRDESTDPAGCIERYRALLVSQPGFAEAHFRLARLLVARGRWDEAYDHYAAARDLDGLPIRCLTVLQDAYRDAARRYPAVLVDGQAVFHAQGPHGLLDDTLFHDAMHPSVRGHIALAEAVLKALHGRRDFGWAADAPPPQLDPEAVAAHFGIDRPAWKTLCERAAMFYYGFIGARQDAAERTAKHEAYLEAARRIAAGAAPESLRLPNIGIGGDNR
ncbi:MAG: tetratricopeptide repeat protein [Isosphaeraceae bacterium]